MKTALLGLPLLALLAACGDKAPQAVAARPVLVSTVGENGASGLAIYAGEVRARRESDVAFRIGGKLIERRANLGDRVRKGEVLARLDSSDVRLAAAAGAAQVAAAEADVALAKAEYERARSLAERKFVSGTQVDTRQAQLQAAEARLRQAGAQAGVAGNQAAYAVLTAERDGIVTGVVAELGQVVAAGQAVFRIAEPGEREVLINVPESRLAALKVGQQAFVRPWNAQEKTLPGTLREIAGSADVATRTFAVRVSVAGSGDDLPLGTTAAVALAADATKPTNGDAGARAILPLPALMQQGGKTQVWVIDADGKAQARAVEVAAYVDEGAVVKSGLQAGERVVVAGAHTLSAGMPLRPVSAKAPATVDAGR